MMINLFPSSYQLLMVLAELPQGFELCLRQSIHRSVLRELWLLVVVLPLTHVRYDLYIWVFSVLLLFLILILHAEQSLTR